MGGFSMWDDSKIEHYLAIAGVAVSVLSGLASLVNHLIREKQVANEPVSGGLLRLGALLNLLSVNLDKALVLTRAVRGKPLVSGSAVLAQAVPPAPALAPAQKISNPAPVAAEAPLVCPHCAAKIGG
jgi:hypothetical protein